MAISLKSTVAAPVAAYPALKSSIVLFDCNPGTRSWTVPEGVSKIRAFVVGGGGGGWGASGYASGGGGGFAEKLINVTPGQVLSYTVGSAGEASTTSPTAGGTSSIGGAISATGGDAGGSGVGGLGGEGSGGEVNFSGGSGGVGQNYGGGGSGHAFGAGQNGSQLWGGGFSARGAAFVDGWRIGLTPGPGYGFGALGLTGVNAATQPGLGGGGFGLYAAGAQGGIGGGGAANTNGIGGPGLVGIEVIA